MSDLLWIQDILQGNLAALEIPYRAYGQNILNLAWRITQSRQDAEDILQDIFVSLPQKLPSFKGQCKISTWLYKIAYHRSLELKRNQKRRWGILSRFKQDLISPHRAEQPDDWDELQYMLSHLPHEERALLWLKDGEGLEVKELAEIYNLPEGTIKTKLFRTRAKVRQRWEEA